jgi:hypothetical protein
MPAYFDTNVIRYLRTGLTEALPADVRNRIVLSPLSAIEALAQIADGGDDALLSIHRFREWLPENPVILAWAEPFYARHVFDVDLEDKLFPTLSDALNRGLAIEHVTPTVIGSARTLREFSERGKRNRAELFQLAVTQVRAEVDSAKLDPCILNALTIALRQRIGVPPGTKDEAYIRGKLAAYYEFHRQSIAKAVVNKGFRFDSRDHLNDHIDVEQLFYLADEGNHFISCDHGYDVVLAAGQGHRTHVLSADELQNPATAAQRLEPIIMGCTPARPA